MSERTNMDFIIVSCRQFHEAVGALFIVIPAKAGIQC
jgi:hypothetical protein